jgi:hypothetical protein
MPEETIAPPEAPMSTGPTGTPAPAQQQAAPQQTPAPQAPQPQGEKTMVIPHAAMARIKGEEFAKGQQAALDRLAQDSGYESHTDLVSALARLKSAVPAAAPAAQQRAPAAQPQGDDDPAAALAESKAAQREEGKYQRQIEKVINERNRFATQASEWRQQAEEARAEADATRAEMHLRTLAAGVGVQDIDYAITLFSREVERLTPQQAEQFDERAFFTGLRAKMPLLFGETVQPATTGTGTGGAPTPPKPQQVVQQNGQNGRVNARNMSPQEYQALLRSRGLSLGV